MATPVSVIREGNPTILTSVTGLVVWRQLGDLVNASTALGLHRQADTGRTTSFIAETKKRLITVIMNIDKGSSLLTGRPPTLNYRYTRFSWPFDLSEEVLMEGGEALQQAIDALDENGWNTEGEIYSSTATRAHGTLSPLLNEVLELSLGDPAGCTGEQIKSVFSILVFISVLTSSIDTLWIACSGFTLHGPPPCISDLRSCLLQTVPTTVSKFLDFLTLQIMVLIHLSQYSGDDCAFD